MTDEKLIEEAAKAIAEFAAHDGPVDAYHLAKVLHARFEQSDNDALIAEARKRATAKWKGMEGSTNHLVNRLADALESVYADSLTAQAEHARWQERAEQAERAGERILADALARSAELRKERERETDDKLIEEMLLEAGLGSVRGGKPTPTSVDRMKVALSVFEKEHAPSTPSDDEPVAYGIYGRVTGNLKYVQVMDEHEVEEQSEFYDVVPLFRRTEAPKQEGTE